MWRFFCVVLLLASFVFAENSTNSEEAIKQLFDQTRWSDVVSAVEKSARSADLDYYDEPLWRNSENGIRLATPSSPAEGWR